MRLGKKKEKDKDAEKEQCIDGVARLICSAKQSHPVPLRGKKKLMLFLIQLLIIPFNYIASSIHRWYRMDGS